MSSNSPTEERQQWECAECKRQLREDLLVKCTRTDSDFPDGEEVEYLCCECLNKSKWYCHHCGVFCAGITSYEFGPYAGFCDNCAEQIEDDYDEEDYYSNPY
jgi:hypothetical protein